MYGTQEPNLITAPAAEPVSLSDAKLNLRVDVTDDDALITSAISSARERIELETGRQLITAVWELWLDRFPGGTVPYESSAWAGVDGWASRWPTTFGASAGGHPWFIDVPLPPLQNAAVVVTGTTHGSTTVDGITSTAGLSAGMPLKASADFAAGTAIATVSTNAVTLTQPALTSAAGVTVTARSVGITYIDPSGTLQEWDPALYQVWAPSGPYAARGRIAPAIGQSWPLTAPQMAAVKVRFVCGYGADGTKIPQRLRDAILLAIGVVYEHRQDQGAVPMTLLPRGVQSIVAQYKARPITRGAA